MSGNTRQIQADEVINDLVLRHPELLAVLDQYGLDTCCGGGLSLREAARRHSLDVEQLLGSLNAAAA